MERNFLATPGSDIADVVSAMCGAHAQVMSAGETSVALRLAGGTLTGVRESLWTDRTGARLSALDDEVARLGQALAATPSLTIGEVTVGAHA